MASARARGDAIRSEDALGRHPELLEHPEAALWLIAEEIALRQAAGDEVTSLEIGRRFPQWSSQLLQMMDIRYPGHPIGLHVAGSATADMTVGYRVLAELGRGVMGRVLLAVDPALADRPVVLKLTPRLGQEHLALARLQHPNIMPLHSAREFEDRNTRVLCMPYLGGTTLARLIEELRVLPPAARTGRGLLEAVDRAQPAAPLSPPTTGPERSFLSRASYIQATCRIGASLADALHYAHERGLLHLDLKPANVLLAADGRPVLLDFHLARGPILAGAPAPDRIGGTPGAMSPEQRAAAGAALAGRPVPETVDRRSDVYSLGILLYEMLAGSLPNDLDSRVLAHRLRRANPRVGVALADAIARCLEGDPARRYSDAAALGTDLRRHLANLPLAGVPNRSVLELWRKWARRHPGAAARTGVWAAALVLCLLVLSFAGLEIRRRHQDAQAALAEARGALVRQRPSEAIRSLRSALRLTARLPGAGPLRAALRAELRRASRQATAQALHEVADQARLLSTTAEITPAGLATLGRQVRAVWATRTSLLDPSGSAGLGTPAERRLREDLRDLGIVWAHLSVRLAAPGDEALARREGLRILAEAQSLAGPDAALERARQGFAEALGLIDEARAAAQRAAALPPRTARDYRVLGQALIQAGQIEAALEALEVAIERDPRDFWAHLYAGQCASKLGRAGDSIQAFSICIALAPDRAACFVNRAVVYEAVSRDRDALRDLAHALTIDPRSAEATFHRGLVRGRLGLRDEAVEDLHRALELGADPAIVRAQLDRLDRARR
jgi:serine/threonine protein kinase/Tfp pilus assembly protein PilF